MALAALLNLYNITMLSQSLGIICPYLQGPTLIYHDGSGNADVIAKSLSESHTFVIATVPEHPTNNQLFSMRSAILLAEFPEPMASILRMWPLWKARSRVVVFVNNSSEVHDWIETLWKRTRAADLLVIVLSEPPQYFTWFPYKPGECSNVTTIEPVNRSNLFPKKIKPPLNNCPLIAVTTPLPPFVVDEMHGSETRLFRDLAEKVGMKPTFLELPPGQNVWTVFDTQNQPYSAMKLLFDNQIDVVFSEMPMVSITAPFAEFLMPHNAEEYIFFVPGALLAPRTAAIFRAFTLQDWTFVIIASLLIYVTMVAIPFLETGRIEPAFVPAIAIILNIPAKLTSSKAVRIFAVIAYIYSMHITTAYLSSFIVFLSDAPREKPMHSLQDVVDSGLKVQVLISFQSAMDTLSLFSPLMDVINQPDRILYVTQINISEVVERRKCVIAPKISKTFLLRQDVYYDEFDYPLVKMLNEVVVITFLSFYVSKGHPLFEILNVNFIRLIEGGFPGHYSFLVEKPNRPRLRNLEPFGIANVEGPFILLLSLLGVCTFAWIGEWIYFWLQSCFKGRRSRSRSQMRVTWTN